MVFIMRRKFLLDCFVFCLSTGLLLLAACADATGVPGAQGADVLYADGFVPGETGNWVIEGDNAGQTAV